MDVTQELLVSLGLATRRATGAPRAPSRQLPTVADLAQRHNVSAKGIRQALYELARKGLVEYRGRGQGWWTAGDGAPLTVDETADELTRAIAGGPWFPGEPLPPASRLAGELGTTAQTVHLAERLLAARGVLRRRGTRRSPIVALTRLEFALVLELRQTPGQCVPHEALIRSLWPEGGNHDRLKDHLMVLVGRVRCKLGSAVPITTIRGHGYMMKLEPGEGPDLVVADELVLDPATGRARDGMGKLLLSRKQFAVLLLLAQRAGSVVPKPELLEALGDPSADDDTVDAVVTQLRVKLGAERIVAHRGRGYSLAAGDPRTRPPEVAPRAA